MRCIKSFLSLKILIYSVKSNNIKTDKLRLCHQTEERIAFQIVLSKRIYAKATQKSLERKYFSYVYEWHIKAWGMKHFNVYFLFPFAPFRYSSFSASSKSSILLLLLPFFVQEIRKRKKSDAKQEFKHKKLL